MRDPHVERSEWPAFGTDCRVRCMISGTVLLTGARNELPASDSNKTSFDL
jgi:hypothetical protein